MSRAFSPRAVRRAGALTATAAAAFLLTGCFQITDQAMTQTDAVGDVAVTTELCLPSSLNTSPGHPAAPAAGEPNGCPRNHDDTTVIARVVDETTQMFVAYLVPEGFAAPTSVQAKDALVGTTFSASPAYAAALTELAGSGLQIPNGYHWIGYASSLVAPIAPISGGTPHAQLIARFAPQSSSVTDFATRTVFGSRWVRAASDGRPAWSIDRPIVCGESQASESSSSRTDQADCVYSSFPSAEAEAGVQRTRVSTLAITAPATTQAPVAAGSVVRVSFSAKGTRAPEAPASLALSGSSSLAGAVLVAPSTVALGQDAKLDVDVAVPATAASGDYTVSVSAGSGSGVRTATATISVTAAPVASAAPAAQAAEPKLDIPAEVLQGTKQLAAKLSEPGQIKQLIKGASTAGLKLPTRGFARVSLLGTPKKKGAKAPVLAVGTVETDRGQIVNVKLRPTKIGKKLLAGGKTIKGTLVVRLWGREGKTVSAPVSLTLQ